MRARLLGECLLCCCFIAIGSPRVHAQMLTTLYSFQGTPDGARPSSPLVLMGNTLYGSAMYGGVSGVGTVFKINTDGTQFATLFTFNDVNDGNAANPYGLLAVTNDAVCGTTSGLPSGTVFRVNINGSGQTLFIFSQGASMGTKPSVA